MRRISKWFNPAANDLVDLDFQFEELERSFEAELSKTYGFSHDQSRSSQLIKNELVNDVIQEAKYTRIEIIEDEEEESQKPHIVKQDENDNWNATIVQVEGTNKYYIRVDRGGVSFFFDPGDMSIEELIQKTTGQEDPQIIKQIEYHNQILNNSN